MRGLITSTNGVGSMSGCVDVDGNIVDVVVVEADGFVGEIVAVGRLGLQLLSRKNIKLIQNRGERLRKRSIFDKGDCHLWL